jgi:protein-tyrosine phosphatase
MTTSLSDHFHDSAPAAPAAAFDHPDRHLRLPGTRNLRDVGGYPAGPGRQTRWRTLLRTDALDRLPAPSQAQLLDLGLRNVIDLRWPEELDESPSVFRVSDRVAYHHIPLLRDDPYAHLGLAGMYLHMLDERGAQLAAVVRSLIEPEGVPAVIGCAAGKDRTGVAIALILASVGVPHDVIVDDYAMSLTAFAAAVEDEHLIDWRATALEVECVPEYMAAALRHLERRHGGPHELLRRHGVGDAEIQRLADLLTEPTAPSDRSAAT